jgi:hypothetical protein
MRSRKLKHNEQLFHQTSFTLDPKDAKRWDYFVQNNLISSYESELIRLAVVEFLIRLERNPIDFNTFLREFHRKYNRDHRINIQHPESNPYPQIKISTDIF